MQPSAPRSLSIAAVVLASAALVACGQPPYEDPVPHDILDQPYRVCQDLEELTARINNLYRKPHHKLFDASGAAQVETVIFKDVTSGHEIISLTRELCIDIAHGDLARPVWTADGSRILFMGNRALIDSTGNLRRTPWPGKMYTMDANFTDQRAMIVEKFDADGRALGRADGMPGKYNILDPQDPRLAFYADGDKLFRVTLSDDPSRPHRADAIATFATPHRKIIQAISRDRKLLIQDQNADPDRKTGALPYMPEIHLVDLNRAPGEAGYYDHHPFDYGLPEVRDPAGKVLHDAGNNYQFHSLMFGPTSDTIGWNYGPMSSVGEYLGWSLDIRNGLHGTPVHGPVTAGAGGNPFGQYESHGRYVGGTSIGLYFGGPATLSDGGRIGSWGLWLRDHGQPTAPPVYVTDAPGGHVAGGESFDPYRFAAHIHATSPQWRQRVKWSDAIIFGDVRRPDEPHLLCYTYSDVRGGTRTDRATGKVTWSGPDNNDFRPYASIPRPLLSRDATKVWFHSSMLMPTEDWTGIYVAVLRRPDPPTELEATSHADGGVTLTWKPAAGAVETRAFHIYRQAMGGELRDLTPQGAPARVNGTIEPQYRFEDATVAAGTQYTYFVTAEEWSTLESDLTSNLVRITAGAGEGGQSLPARRKWDTTAPPPIAQLTVAPEPDEPGQYRLTWAASGAPDLRHYNIYFSPTERPQVSQKRLIASPPAGSTTYLDWSAPIEGGGHYVITAVDRQGNESPPTPGR